MTVTPETLSHARDIYRRHISATYAISSGGRLVPHDQRELIRELQEIGFTVVEAYAFVNSGGTADVDEITRIAAALQPPQPAERLVLPVGLLEAITERLDAIEQRLTALEQPRPHVTVSHPTGSPPQPIVIVTYPEDLGE